MEDIIEIPIKDMTVELLASHPIGEKLNQAMQFIQSVRQHLYALAEKQDEMEMTGVKVSTVLTFAILGKIADGRKPKEFNKEDWKEIAQAVSEYAILPTDQAYSVFVFGLYERYIRFSIETIKGIVSESTYKAVSGLADELQQKSVLLQEGTITETGYTEDCLWISLEAMIKLLASTAALSGDQKIEEFVQALASYAFEYGRLMLYSRELEIVSRYLESQRQLDEELEQKFAAYLDDLQRQNERFYCLIDHAFSPDFREAFLHSILLAEAVGVDSAEILSSTSDVDSFFLD